MADPNLAPFAPTPSDGITLKERAIINYAAMGMHEGEIARQLSAPISQVTKVLERHAVAVENERISLTAKRMLVLHKFNEHFERAVDNVGAILANSDHKEHGQTSRWVIDKHLPTVQVVQSEARHTLDPTLSAALTTSLNTYTQLMRAAGATPVGDFTSHVIDGKDAIPNYEKGAAPAAQPPTLAPVGEPTLDPPPPPTDTK